jgi:hypothetical protein
VLGLRRVGEADPAQHVDHRLVPLALAQRLVQRERLADLVADGVQRRERRHRLLENDRDAPAADVLHRAPRGVEAGDVDFGSGKLGIAEHDLARLDARDARQDAHDRLRHHRLARARFAHQRDRAPGRDAERDAVDRLDGAGVDIEVNLEIPDGEQISHARGQYTRRLPPPRASGPA